MQFKNRERIGFAQRGPFGFLFASDITDGPFPCDRCKELSCFAHITLEKNTIFCKNERCGFKRVIDKRNMIIIEDDGSHWQYDNDGHKVRIRAH